MTQLNLWQTTSVEDTSASDVVWKLYIDGASKKNPGPSGAGFSLVKNKKIICEQGFYLGEKTNNQAEYFALLLGIFFTKKYMKKDHSLVIISDSQLLVRQMNKIYKVKDAYLRKMQQLATIWLQSYNVQIEHVLREFNQKADKLANRGVEKRVSPPKNFVDMLQAYEIIV